MGERSSRRGRHSSPPGRRDLVVVLEVLLAARSSAPRRMPPTRVKGRGHQRGSTLLSCGSAWRMACHQVCPVSGGARVRRPWWRLRPCLLRFVMLGEVGTKAADAHKAQSEHADTRDQPSSKRTSNHEVCDQHATNAPGRVPHTHTVPRALSSRCHSQVRWKIGLDKRFGVIRPQRWRSGASQTRHAEPGLERVRCGKVVPDDSLAAHAKKS